MKLGPILMATLAVTATACSGESQSAGTEAVAKQASSDTGASVGTIDPAEQCVHTDPAMRPISVHRALSCPDGTTVSVVGIIVGTSDGSVRLCDSAAEGDYCVTIEGGVRPIDDSPAPITQIFYTGIISHGVLSLAAPPVDGNLGTVVVSPLSRPSTPLRSG